MKEEPRKINTGKWIFYFSIALAVIIVYKVLDNFTSVTTWISNFFGVIAPFIGGFLIAYILYLPCKKIEDVFKKTKKKSFFNKHARGISVLLGYIIAAIILVIILNVIIPIIMQSLTDLISNIPGYYSNALEKINSLPDDHFLKSETANEIIGNISNIDLKKLASPDKIMEYLKGVMSAVSNVFNIFIAVIVSVYILLQRKGLVDFWSKFLNKRLGEEKFKKVDRYFRNGNEIFFKFLTSQIIDALVVGIITSIAMLILGVKYAVLLGFIIGLFNLIPFFGAIVAVTIAIIITLLTGGLGKAVLMAVIVIILQQIDANIINPKIIGNSLKISQILVIFAVTVGGAYFGVLGMFLAVPFVTVIKMMMEDYSKDVKINKNE